MDPVNRYYGLYRGVVKDNKDPQKQRRLKLSIPQITGTEKTEWAWPMEPSSISTDVPEIGQAVGLLPGYHRQGKQRGKPAVLR